MHNSRSAHLLRDLIAVFHWWRPPSRHSNLPAYRVFRQSLVSLQERSLARIQLTAGYAEYTLGKYYNSLGHIRQALVRQQELSERDRSFLLRLKDISEVQAGLIDSTTYRERNEEWAKQLQGVEVLEAELEASRYRLLTERDRNARSWLTEKIHAITTQICAHAEATDAIKLSASLASLYVEGTAATMELSHQLALSKLRPLLKSGTSKDMLESYEAASRRVVKWEAESEAAVKRAYEIRHPLLIADALAMMASVRVAQQLNKRFDAISRDAVDHSSSEPTGGLSEMIGTAIRVYEMNGSIEGALRVKMLQADLLELLGDVPGAKKVAAEVRPVADAMGYTSLLERAQEVLNDNTILMQFCRQWKDFRSVDEDVSFAELTDAQLREFARDTLEALGLPANRLVIKEQYVHSLRDIARERVHWCRFLQLEEDLRQTTDPSVAFTVLPNRQCVCRKHGFRTTIVTSEAPALIGTFKQQYCAGCQDRSALKS